LLLCAFSGPAKSRVLSSAAEDGELEDGEICDDDTEERAPPRRGDGSRPRGGAPPRPRKPHKHPHGAPPHLGHPPPDFRHLMPYSLGPHGPFPAGHRQQCGPSGPDRPPSPPPSPQQPPGLGSHGEPGPRSSFWERSHGTLGRFRHRGMPNGGPGGWSRGGRGGNSRPPPGRYLPGESHSSPRSLTQTSEKPLGRNRLRKAAHGAPRPESSGDESFEDLLSKYKQIQIELECIRKEETMALEPRTSPVRDDVVECVAAALTDAKAEPGPALSPAAAAEEASELERKKVFQAFNIKPLRQKLPTPADLDELQKKWAEPGGKFVIRMFEKVVVVEEEELSELQLRLLALQSASKKWQQKEQQVMRRSKERITKAAQEKSSGSAAKQAFRKQQVRTWKLQQQREQEEKRRQEEEERRKREDEIRRIRDLSNQDEQYNRFMKLVGGRKRTCSKDRDHRKSAGKPGLDTSGNLYQYDNYDEVAMDTDSETGSPGEGAGGAPDPPFTSCFLFKLVCLCFSPVADAQNSRSPSSPAALRHSSPTSSLPPPPDELEPPPKPPFADEAEEEEMLLRETCLMSMANKRVVVSEKSSSAPPSPGGPPPADLQPPPRGNLSTVSLNTVPQPRPNKAARAHLILPRHKAVVVSLNDSDDSDSDMDACSSSQAVFGGLEFMIKEARRTVEAAKPKGASASEKENNPVRTPEALPDAKKAEYRLLKEEIASRERQRMMKEQSPRGSASPATADSDSSLKPTAELKLSEAELKLTKHRELLQRDEAMLRHLLQQELKKNESLKAAEAKVAKLREQLQASERIVSANKMLLRKLREQVHRVEQRVSVKKTVAVRLEQELLQAHLAAGRAPKRRADSSRPTVRLPVSLWNLQVVLSAVPTEDASERAAAAGAAGAGGGCGPRRTGERRLSEGQLKVSGGISCQRSVFPVVQVFPAEVETAVSSSSSSELRPLPFRPYHSPLLVFRSYRFSPYYRTKEKLSLSSVTYSNAIEAKKCFCRFDLTGTCNDDGCRWQHMRNCTLSGNQLFQDILSYDLSLIGCSDSSSDEDVCAATGAVGAMPWPGASAGVSRGSSGVCVCLQRMSSRVSVCVRADGSAHIVLSTLDACVTSEDKRYFISETDDIANLEVSVLESPRDTQLWIKLAFKYLNQSEISAAECLEAALNTLSRALESNCDNPEVWSHYLSLFSRRGSREEVQEMCEMAVEHAPDYRVWWNYLNLESSFEGKDYVCERLLQFLLAESSSGVMEKLSFQLMEALLYRVQLSLFTGRLESALAVLQNALKSPQDRSIADHLTAADRALLWLSYIHLTEFDRLPACLYDPAESGPSRVVSREPFLLPWRTPRDVRTPADILVAFFQDGVRQCSDEHASDSERTLACLPLHTNLIFLYKLLQRYSEGIALCESLLEFCPESCILRDALAGLHLHGGSGDRAVSMWLHALAECPHNAEVFYHCCKFLMAQKAGAITPLFRGFVLSLCEDEQSPRTPVDVLRYVPPPPSSRLYRWQWLHGSVEDAAEAFERALGAVTQLEDYLMFSCSPQARAASQSRTFSDLVQRCLSTTPSRLELPFNPAEFWNCYRFHNKVRGRVCCHTPPTPA
uniref:Zinc finger C3H1-type containing n=1 Tax=Oreochromis niloticus TaxID=8128 RepID=A0A669BT26_ORENI